MATKTRKTATMYETSIVNGALYFEDCKQSDLDGEYFAEIIDHKTTTSIRLISLSHDYAQRVWLESGSKIIEQVNVEMTLRKEIRSGVGHWYAYRRVHTKLHKKYVGTSEKVTHERLLEIAKAMPST